MSDLDRAIARSFSPGRAPLRAESPMAPLGRRRMGGTELVAQSVATTAPAASMAMLPLVVGRLADPLAGLLVVVGATVAVTLVAVCLGQFTRRQAAAGGVYSFVFQGLGARASLTAAVVIGCKYLGSAAITLYAGGRALTALAGAAGLDVSGAGAQVLLHLVVAAGIATVLVRGPRVAALTLLGVEAGSLLLVVAVLLVPAPDPAAPVPAGPVPDLLAVALTAMFMLAGFESATFFGPEARRPLVTVTRVVLWTPLLCGALLSFAAWAGWTGRAATLVRILTDPGSAGVPTALVVALHAGLACSYLASAAASAHAASRVAFSLGVERLLPRFLATVHPRWRTPHRAVVGIVAVVLAGGLLADLAPSGTDAVRHLVRALVTVAYVLVALASVAFLLRIREHTRPALVTGAAVGVLGTLLLVLRLPGLLGAVDGTGAAVALVACCAAGPVWWWFLRRRPDRLARIGAFDQPGSDDVLPGAGDFVPDASGTPRLVRRDRRAGDPP
ncbi:APC family permease [Pseudonocardia sp. ICBG162]|uniref:APC family permease n=1 Tax=Pseudonocardia sp. ICBG162 TaxID=2846761 RepID=UPI001CF60C4C|nr:APC family permease [Pseudonocardia sp. ICBG162]